MNPYIITWHYQFYKLNCLPVAHIVCLFYLKVIIRLGQSINFPVSSCSPSVFCPTGPQSSSIVSAAGQAGQRTDQGWRGHDESHASTTEPQRPGRRSGQKANGTGGERNEVPDRDQHWQLCWFISSQFIGAKVAPVGVFSRQSHLDCFLAYSTFVYSTPWILLPSGKIARASGLLWSTRPSVQKAIK